MTEETPSTGTGQRGEMSPPKVSVMIPTYNQQVFVQRAIESALAQDYPNIEVVVADDHSLDQTAAVVERFIERHPGTNVSLVRHPENLGILRNYHTTLFHHVSGEWVINLDGDDFFVDPSFIRQAMQRAAEDGRVVLVFGDYCEHAEATGERVDIRNPGVPALMDGNDFITRYARGGVSWNHNSIVYRRADALAQGFYWDADGNRNDWESFLRLVLNRRVGHVEAIAAAWVQHAFNETARRDPRKYLHNYTLIRGVGNAAQAQGVSAELAARWVSLLNWKETRSSLFAYLKQGDLRGAAHFLRKVARIDRRLPWRALAAPSVWLRALLGLHPGLYARAKAWARAGAA